VDKDVVQALATSHQKAPVPVAWFKDGDLLELLARAHVSDFKTLAPDLPSAPSGRRTWGTMCSCSEGCHFVMAAMKTVYDEEGIRFDCVQAMACEIDESRRVWINGIINEGRDPEDAVCIFNDIGDMHKNKAQCWTHKALCEVPSLDFLILGTSCKDFSNQSSAKDRNNHVLAKATSKGGSSDTVRGFLNYIDSHRPLAILFENVDAMDDDVGSSGVSNLDLLFAEVGSRGYEGRDFIVDSQYFSLPQRRRRRYIIFIFAIANPGVDFRLRESSTVFETMGRLVSACQRMPPCVSRILLTEDHVALENELTRRLAGDRLEKDVAEWPELHINVFRDAGKRWKALKIQKKAKGSPWFSTLTPRERDALRYELALFPEYFARDISQSIDRISRSCRHEHDSDRHILPT
jgi:site-specific DNA-cytosine methylase